MRRGSVEWVRRQRHCFPADVHVSLRVRAGRRRCHRSRRPQQEGSWEGRRDGVGDQQGRGGRGGGGVADSPPPRLHFSQNSCFFVCFSAGKQIPKANSSELSWPGPAQPGPAATTTRNKKGKQETNRSVSRERFFRVAAQRQQTERAGEDGRGETESPRDAEAKLASFPPLHAHLKLPYCT